MRKRYTPIWPEYGIGCGEKAFDGKREKALLCDPDHKKYSRAARHEPNLPDAQTNTKWLKKQKSWKDRIRKRKQWERRNE